MVVEAAERRHRVRIHEAAVWLLTFAIAWANYALARRLVGVEALPGAKFTIPFWALAPAYYLAERTVVHFRFQRHAYSLSLSEIPLVIGLFFCSPIDLIGGQLIGSAAALLIHRRQRPLKLLFNLSQIALQNIVALTVFRSLATGPLEINTALAVMAGGILAWYVANSLISLAIVLSGGKVGRTEMAGVLAAGLVAATINIGLGLVIVYLMWLAPHLAWAALMPAAFVYLSYRSYSNQKLEHNRLVAIYEATKELHGAPQLETALSAAVTRACKVFEAEEAEIILIPNGMDGDSFSTRATSSELLAVMERRQQNIEDPVTLMALAGTGGYIGNSLRSNDSRVDIIAAPIVEDKTVVGIFIVRHPSGDMVDFTSHDLTLLETMANQVAVSLENGRLEDSLVQLTQLKEELRHQTLHDPLTGLANRTLVQERLERLLAKDNETAAMVFLDLDDFKTVNDTFGHHAGDELLVEVAARLVRSCRDHDTVARVGGDEFAILLTRLHAPADVEVVASRILQGLATPFSIGGQAVFTGASIGITHIVSGDHSDDVLRRADRAMYTAKQSRKGSFRVFGESMESEAKRASRLRMDAQTALLEGEIQLHYQPIVDLTSGRTMGAEGLIRWNHPELGYIPPHEILATADDAGLTDLLSGWTIEQACTDAARFQQVNPDFAVTVNVEADQIRPELVETVRTALYGSGINPHSLVLEITESAAIQGAAEVFADLDALGIRIALDDFGTGYSSLSRLDTLPIDIVKVDRGFVERMLGPNASPLAQMVLEIGHTFGLSTVAEGIETVAQRDRLIDMGCSLGQGFLFSAAVPASQLDPGMVLAPVL